MARKITTSLLLFLLFMLPTQVSEASPIDGQLDKGLDEVEKTVEEVNEIDLAVQQSNQRISSVLKEKAFQAVYDRSQLLQNVTKTKKELQEAKQTSLALQKEVKRIRADQDLEINEEDLAKLIKQTANTVRVIKESDYTLGTSTSEFVGLLQEVKSSNVLGAKAQLDALVQSSNERVASLEKVNEELTSLLQILQAIE